VHASANTTALGLYVASLLARRAGDRERGKALSWLGLGAVFVGGYLGGHLSYSRGVNVNRTAFEDGPQEWTAVMPETDLGEGQLRHARAGDAPVLLVRDGGQVHALASTCTHLGGPLHEGQLADGSVVRGPASAPQPAYETRVRDGQVEVRARA
jgi:nitrite reductase/ring-hydroxylating ferredoxin subunit